MITKAQKNKLRMYLKNKNNKMGSRKTYEYHDEYCDRQVFSNGVTLFMVEEFIKGEGIEIDKNDNFCRNVRHVFEKASDACDPYPKDPLLHSDYFKLKDLKMMKKNAKSILKNKTNIEYRDPCCGEIIRIYNSKDIMVKFGFWISILGMNDNNVFCYRWINLDYLIEAMEILNYKTIKMNLYKVNDAKITKKDYYNDGYSLPVFIMDLNGPSFIDINHSKLGCIIPALCY